MSEDDSDCYSSSVSLFTFHLIPTNSAHKTIPHTAMENPQMDVACDYCSKNIMVERLYGIWRKADVTSFERLSWDSSGRASQKYRPSSGGSDLLLYTPFLLLMNWQVCPRECTHELVRIALDVLISGGSKRKKFCLLVQYPQIVGTPPTFVMEGTLFLVLKDVDGWHLIDFM